MILHLWPFKFAPPTHMTWSVRVITQSLEANTSKMYDDYHMLATYRPKPSRVKFKPHLNLDLNKQVSRQNPKIVFKKLKPDTKKKSRPLIRIRSVNRTKGVKLGFEYNHVGPSGFGIAPIKRVPIAMFSLVWIWPMFEQEAPKWPWEVFNDPYSTTIQVRPKRG